MKSLELDKGSRAEELLREYFISCGFYVVRGAKVYFQKIEVSDVDLWLYSRPSLISRSRINVDLKRKGAPKALERILWTKGLQDILRTDQCIVATTDKRPLVKDFGDRNGVKVLDGNFMDRLLINDRKESGRLSEEEFINAVRGTPDDKFVSDWKTRFFKAKNRIVVSLGFDSCNAWLEDSRFFIEQSLVSRRAEIACRLTYLVLSFFLIGLDFVLAKNEFDVDQERVRALEEGLKFGDRGMAQTEQTVNLASRLIATYAPGSNSLGDRIRVEVTQDMHDLPTGVLVNYFTREEVRNSLFDLAFELESIAFGRNFVHPDKLGSPMKAALAVVLDYHQIERKRFFSILQ
jgi:hypothetical protein